MAKNVRSGFKQVAYQILKEQGKPLHSNDITQIALKQGLLATDGKTPEATMNAQLIVDINRKGDKSNFIKTGPSTFYINEVDVPFVTKEDMSLEQKKQSVISKVSSKQKGDIAEARIAELVTLYGDNEISCFEPISDDEGIDLIVKPKGQLKSLYIQVKSRFGDNPNKAYTATVKATGLVEHYSMMYLFCYFDTLVGDIWDYVWLVPAPDFKRYANQLDNGARLGFVAGRRRSDGNKWDKYLIHKTDLSEEIIKQLQRID